MKKLILHLKDKRVEEIEDYQESIHKNIPYTDIRILLTEDLPVYDKEKQDLYYIKGKVYIKKKELEEKHFHIRQKKIKQVNDYYNSESVKMFRIQHTTVWLNKEEREELKKKVEADSRLKKELTDFYCCGFKFIIKLVNLENLLLLLNNYASKCYDVAQNHIENINNITNVRELTKYDFKTGYPKKLIF